MENVKAVDHKSSGGTWHNIGLIIAREYKTRVYKRSFVITTGIIMVVALTLPFVPIVISKIVGDGQQNITVVETGQAANLQGQNLITTLDKTLNTTANSNGTTNTSTSSKPKFVLTKGEAANLTKLRQDAENGNLQGLLIVNRAANGDLSFEYVAKSISSGDSNLLTLRQAVSSLAITDRLERNGIISSQAASTLFTPPAFTTTSQDDKPKNGRTSTEQGIAIFLSIILVVMLFTTLQIYGNATAQGVAEEKSSRIMEIMITAATPPQLLFGKVVGIGLVGISSVLLIIGSAIIGIIVQKPVAEAVLGAGQGISFDLAGASLTTLFFFPIFFFLGYLLYALLYAAVGSLCSRIEDVQQAVAPLVFLSMSGYFVTIFAINALDETWVKVLSFIPFYSPMLMFARLGVTEVSPIEVFISIALLIATIFLATLFAARIYRVGVLMYGNRLSLRQAIGLGRASK